MDKNVVVDGLMEVRDLISDPNHWVKQTDCVTVPVRADNEFGFVEVEAYCLRGAARNVGLRYWLNHRDSPLDLTHELMTEMIRTIRTRGEHYSSSSVIGFNDNALVTHKDVLDLVDDTIRRVKGE